jgi:cation-transporting ATPase 13A3/4/5
MCGDGANDCGALKTADAGVSLSESEASIAAPFTSKIQNISCCVTLIKEGKASLTATFQTFKFIELYALIQFYFTFILYFVGVQPTDGQYLYIDLMVTFPLTIFIAGTKPQEKLTADLPTESLFYVPILMSVSIMAAIQFAFQTFFFLDI